MKINELLQEEKVGGLGASHLAILTHADLTEVTADTDQAITLLTTAAYISVGALFVKVKTPFEDESDAAFNDVKVTVGDEDTANEFITAAQVNANGTYVKVLSNAGSQKFMHDYAAAKAVQITFESMAAKSLVNIDKGELYVYLRIIDGR